MAILLSSLSAAVRAEESLERVLNFAATQTPQDRQEIATAVRSISQIQYVSGDNVPDALAVRGAPGQLRIAEWVFSKLDNPVETQVGGQQNISPATDELRLSSDDVVRVFYLHHADSLLALQEVATTVRSVSSIRNLNVEAPRKAIVMRGTNEQVAITEWLIEKLDRAPAGQAVARPESESVGQEFRPSATDDVVRVFYLPRIETPQALQEISTEVRRSTRAPREFALQSKKALVMRGTNAQMQQAERLLKANGK